MYLTQSVLQLEKKTYMGIYVFLYMWSTCKTQIVPIPESSKFHNLQMLTNDFLACEGKPTSADPALLVPELFIVTKKPYFKQ